MKTSNLIVAQKRPFLRSLEYLCFRELVSGLVKLLETVQIIVEKFVWDQSVPI